MLNLGMVRPGTTIYFPFDTFAGATGASITLTGLAVTDIEIYKDGSMTQRGSDNGYTLLDTDGIDLDGITGIMGFSVDLADNSTAGFYAAGSKYWVVVSSVTIDSQTVNFIAGFFTIGYPDAVINTTIATLASQTSFTLTSGPAEDDAINGSIVCIHDVASAVQLGYAVVLDYTGSTKTVTLAAGTTYTAAATDNISIFPPSNITHAAAVAWGSGAITAGAIAADAITAAKIADGAIDAATFAASAINAAAIATGAITNAKFAAGAIDAAAIADNAIDAGAIAADAITAAKIADGAIDAATFAASAITATAIATGAITNAKFAAGAIDAAAIADNAIDAGSIAADAITAAKIADGAIDAATFAASAINAAAIATGAITNAKFAVGAIDAAAIADGAIDAGAIAADAITAAKIADGAIDAATFAASAINATAIATGAITAAKFAANALDAAALAADAVTEIQSGLATSSALATTDGKVDLIKAKTDNLPSDPADESLIIDATNGILTAIAALNNLAAGAAMTLTAGERNAVADALAARSLGAESYSADGAVPTFAQAFFEILSILGEFSISGTTITCKKRNGSTTAFTSELDSATVPTSRTRAS